VCSGVGGEDVFMASTSPAYKGGSGTTPTCTARKVRFPSLKSRRPE
jgi:hypothetical protein